MTADLLFSAGTQRISEVHKSDGDHVNHGLSASKKRLADAGSPALQGIARMFIYKNNYFAYIEGS